MSVGGSRSLSLWPFGGQAKENGDTLENIEAKAQELASSASSKVEQAAAQTSESAQAATSKAQEFLQSPSSSAPAEGTIAAASDALDHASNSISEGVAGVASKFANEFEAGGLPSGWPPVPWIQHGLEWVTQSVGLPWWATIIGATIAIRVSLAPLVVKLQANNIRLTNIQPEMQGLMKDLTHAKESGNMQEMGMAAKKVQKLMKDNNASPFKSFGLPFVQMPVFLTMFFALRGMANAGLPSMTEGGFGWISNLTIPDPYIALPITSAIATLAVMETGAELGAAAQANTPQQKMIRNVLRVVLVLTPWFVKDFPAVSRTKLLSPLSHSSDILIWRSLP